MASLDLTAFDAALKQHYTQDRIVNTVYKDHPLLSMLATMEKFGGKNLPIPIQYGVPQGRSATFSTAKTNKTPSQFTDFVLTRAKDYGLASIDNETLEASKGDPNSFLDAVISEIDGALQSVGNSLAQSLYLDGSGAIGQLSAEPAETSGTFVMILENEDDIVNFEVGQVLVAWSAKTGGTQKNSDGSDTKWPIAAVDRDSGEITVTGTYNSSGTLAANDYLFVEGDRGLKIKGLQAWLPFTAPSPSENFFGVDRSVDVTRLAGHRHDGSSQPIEEALIDLSTKIAREGFAPDHCFLNWAKWGALEKSLGSKVHYEMVQVKPAGANATVGFKAICLEGGRKSIKVIPDFNCPSDYAFMLQMEYWKLYSLGKAPRILMTDGLKMLRETDEDGVEVRTGYYAQMGCRAPVSSGVVKLS